MLGIESSFLGYDFVAGKKSRWWVLAGLIALAHAVTAHVIHAVVLRHTQLVAGMMLDGKTQIP